MPQGHSDPLCQFDRLRVGQTDSDFRRERLDRFNQNSYHWFYADPPAPPLPHRAVRPGADAQSRRIARGGESGSDPGSAKFQNQPHAPCSSVAGGQQAGRPGPGAALLRPAKIRWRRLPPAGHARPQGLPPAWRQGRRADRTAQPRLARRSPVAGNGRLRRAGDRGPALGHGQGETNRSGGEVVQGQRPGTAAAAARSAPARPA